MTRPVPRPFNRPAFTPLAPHIQNEIDARQKAEINQAWRQKEIYDDLAHLEMQIIPAPALADAFMKPHRFTRIEN